MRLQRISITDYRFFNNFELNFESATLKPNTTGIYGENGTGKTTILRIIRDISQTVFTYFNFLATDTGVDKGQKRFLLISTLDEVYSRLAEMYGDSTISLHFVNTKAKPVVLTYNGRKVSVDGRPLNHFFDGKGKKTIEDIPVLCKQLKNVMYQPSIAQLQIDLFNNLIKKESNDIVNSFIDRHFDFLSKHRKIYDYANAYMLNTNLEELQEEYKDHKNGRKSSFPSFKELVNSFFSCKQLSSVEDGVVWFTIDSKESELVQLSDLSAGERNIFIKLLRIYSRKISNGIILLDEPETSYHFSWAQKLIHALSSIPGCRDNQIIFASHSQELAESCEQFISLTLDKTSYQLKVTDTLKSL